MARRNLIILPEAEQDVAQAYIWYEEQELGLGEEYLRCVDAWRQKQSRRRLTRALVAAIVGFVIDGFA